MLSNPKWEPFDLKSVEPNGNDATITESNDVELYVYESILKLLLPKSDDFNVPSRQLCCSEHAF